MGSQVVTLEDLLRPSLRVVCIGINPAPRSVTAGHYYQGRLGQAFYTRLRRVGLLAHGPGWEDDLAWVNGVGFTDIVKRPTASAKDVRPEEFEHGRDLLVAKLERAGPRLALFTFKKTAEVLFGRIEGCGLVARLELDGAPVFVMPGPYAPRHEVDLKLRELARTVGPGAAG